MEGNQNFEVRWTNSGFVGEVNYCNLQGILANWSSSTFFYVLDRMFDYQLIPEFGGAATNEPVIQWIQQVRMNCNLCKKMDVELILPSCPQDGTPTLYQQLNKEEKGSLQLIKLDSRFVQHMQSFCSAVT